MNQIDLIIRKLSIKHRLPEKVIKSIAESQFEFAVDTIKKLNFDEVDSKEKFEQMKTNFNFKYLFSLSANYGMLEKIKQRKDETTSSDSKES